jgi:site-specific DNA-methyltransferase (cytosine-N4-specific)
VLTISSVLFDQLSDSNPVHIILGDARQELARLPDGTFQSCITSPPYWGVRDYGVNGQIGAEPVLTDYVNNLVGVFREVRRVLKEDGTFWLNIANTYTSGGRKWRQEDAKNKGRFMAYRPPTPTGLKKKDLIGVAWMVAMACQLDGWYLRNDIIWAKPNCQPESVKDRFTVSHEYLFLMTKSERYAFNQEAILEPCISNNGHKNKRTVWSINTEAFAEAHFAVFPTELVKPCLLAGSAVGDLVLDPFFGAGTVGLVAAQLKRRCVGIEMKPDYVSMAKRRLSAVHAELPLKLPEWRTASKREPCIASSARF